MGGFEVAGGCFAAAASLPPLKGTVLYEELTDFSMSWFLLRC